MDNLSEFLFEQVLKKKKKKLLQAETDWLQNISTSVKNTGGQEKQKIMKRKPISIRSS